MYSVYQHWDPLKVCMVGKSYPPEFYSFIKNSRVRTVMERIAQETEEDYQSLVKLLESFGVETLRPTVGNDYKEYIRNNKILVPPMVPRDYGAMIGETFYFDYSDINFKTKWQQLRGSAWPVDAPFNKQELDALPNFIKNELKNFNVDFPTFWWEDALEKIPNTKIFNNGINSAMITRVGKDLYFGTLGTSLGTTVVDAGQYAQQFSSYRTHVIDTQGHSDATFCPVKPGLIVSLYDVPTYQDTFPEWEVVYLPGQSWNAIPQFLKLKKKNQGKWWVPGEELNDEFTNFVESWLEHWVGYVEETVFDVNMLVIDERNVICNNYNKKVFDAFDRHGVTAHVLNFRHRYFWDGGLHCITNDIHREGVQQDYFPERI